MQTTQENNNIDILENLVRELNKSPNNKLGEEIKQLIIEVTINILNSKNIQILTLIKIC